MLGTGEFGASLFHAAVDETRARGPNLRTQMRRLLDLLEIFGVFLHSPRKGSITHACGGTPELAPLVAVIIRARWSTREWSLLMKYAKQQGAADSLVGRLLALLDPQAASFGVIAPHFILDGENSTSNKEVKELVAVVFGHIAADGARRAAPFLAASLFYHYDYLKQTIPASHPLWESPFGRMLPDRVKKIQTCISIKEDSNIHASGIPTTVKIMQQNEACLLECRAFASEFRDQLHHVRAELSEIAKLLPMSAVGLSLEASTQRFQEWSGSIQSVIEKTIEQSIDKRLPQHQTASDSASTSAAEESTVTGRTPSGYNLYTWGGKFRIIPANFVYSRNTKVHSAWELWWNGYQQGDMPLRSICNSDEQYHRDIFFLYRLQAERRQVSSNVVNAAIHELKRVMSYLEKSIVHEDATLLHHLEEVTAASNNYRRGRIIQARAWKIALSTMEMELGPDAPFRNQSGVPARKRRRHNIALFSVRTIFKLLSAKEQYCLTTV